MLICFLPFPFCFQMLCYCCHWLLTEVADYLQTDYFTDNKFNFDRFLSLRLTLDTTIEYVLLVSIMIGCINYFKFQKTRNAALAPTQLATKIHCLWLTMRPIESFVLLTFPLQTTTIFHSLLPLSLSLSPSLIHTFYNSFHLFLLFFKCFYSFSTSSLLFETPAFGHNALELTLPTELIWTISRGAKLKAS